MSLFTAHTSIAESMVLSDLLDKYIHPTTSDPIVRHELDQYVRAADAVYVLMKDNTQPTSQRSDIKHCSVKVILFTVSTLFIVRYHWMNKQLSLCENFIGKTIVEYPRLVVVLESHLADYSLLDDELAEEKERERLTREERGEGLTHTTTLHVCHGQEQVVPGTLVDEPGEEHRTSSRDCPGEENTPALKLIAQCYSDSDEEST